ncbi:glutathione S-transferase N-terminal domain-containing protein [Psychrobacter aquimaris]|uniref:glutathione S-transferase N-terminal domain-containing protein n=1 Tax=Psychrobacter aquimaris TaxID=292733 RepID=UPI0039C61619
MPMITPTNKSVTKFEGLHLYHAPFSNCAMRVRIALAEKQLEWTSHLSYAEETVQLNLVN